MTQRKEPTSDQTLVKQIFEKYKRRDPGPPPILRARILAFARQEEKPRNHFDPIKWLIVFASSAFAVAGGSQVYKQVVLHRVASDQNVQEQAPKDQAEAPSARATEHSRSEAELPPISSIRSQPLGTGTAGAGAGTGSGKTGTSPNRQRAPAPSDSEPGKNLVVQAPDGRSSMTGPAQSSRSGQGSRAPANTGNGTAYRITGKVFGTKDESCESFNCMSPVGSVTVCASEMQDPAVRSCTVSAASGAYQINLPAKGSFRISALAPGYREFLLENYAVDESKTLNIKLIQIPLAYHSLRGTAIIVQKETIQNPSSILGRLPTTIGASVCLTPLNCPAGKPDCMNDPIFNPCVTTVAMSIEGTSSSAFAFPSVPALTYLLKAQRAGFADFSQRIDLFEDKENFAIPLVPTPSASPTPPPEYTLTLTVVGPDGLPLSYIQACLTKKDPVPHEDCYVAETIKGTVVYAPIVIPGLVSGTYTFTVSAPGSVYDAKTVLEQIENADKQDTVQLVNVNMDFTPRTKN